MKKKLIVVVEDDLIQARTAQIIIEEDDRLKGFECKKYCSYENALENFEVLKQATIILMDIDLSGTKGRIINPTTEGITLVDKVHRVSPDIPVIYTTAYGRDFYPQIGYNELLDKPITSEALVTRILLVLERQKKAKRRILNIVPQEIDLEHKGEKQSVKIDAILMVESTNGTFVAHTSEKIYTSTHTIRNVDEFLVECRGSIIVKISRGFCLNIRQLKGYELCRTYFSDGKKFQKINLLYDCTEKKIAKYFNVRFIDKICNKLDDYINRKNRKF